MKKKLFWTIAALSLINSVFAATEMSVIQNDGTITKYDVREIKEIVFTEVTKNPASEDILAVDESETPLKFIFLSDSTVEVKQDGSYKVLDSIAIPDKVIINGEEYSVTSIGHDAFRGCRMENISIPSSITHIDTSAFNSCTWLTSIEIPSQVSEIEATAFLGCDKLTSIQVDSDNPYFTSLDGVLFNKNKTEIICVPKGIKGQYSIPSGVTIIGDDAFYGCDYLTAIEIPSSVTRIGEGAFGSCDQLTSIEIPSNVTSIELGAFAQCSELREVKILSSNAEIGYGAFQFCSKLESINLPDETSYIGESAFSGCSSLTSIKLPSNITTINTASFSGCTELKKVEIHEGVVSIEESAFYKCENLVDIELPSTLTHIGPRVFANCSSLTEITIPSSVETIEHLAFYECKNLNVTINNTEKNISVGTKAFYGVKSVNYQSIP